MLSSLDDELSMLQSLGLESFWVRLGVAVILERFEVRERASQIL